MLDFDSLAEKRAAILRQSPEEWRRAIWDDAFQKLSQELSDGEVEHLIDLCPSSYSLTKIAGHLLNCDGGPRFDPSLVKEILEDKNA